MTSSLGPMTQEQWSVPIALSLWSSNQHEISVQTKIVYLAWLALSVPTIFPTVYIIPVDKLSMWVETTIHCIHLTLYPDVMITVKWLNFQMKVISKDNTELTICDFHSSVTCIASFIFLKNRYTRHVCRLRSIIKLN